ncbi:MAG: hypothetical protein HY682_00045 [Chloroflexi bacterium]|nr:hypothetical protein [Chloroflexota bacterium]
MIGDHEIASGPFAPLLHLVRPPIYWNSNRQRTGRLYVATVAPRKALVALLTILFVAMVSGCRDRAVPPASTTPPSITPTPTGVVVGTPTLAATAPLLATSSPGSSLDARLDQIERGVEEIRGLRSEGETRRRFVDSAALVAAINDELDKADIREQIASDQRLYQLLGLIQPGDDLDRLYRALLGSQVLGLYDPDTEEFLVLRAGDDLSALAESTYAHEYTHRLQDVRFDLDRMTDEAGDNSDRQIALSALIEGDATVTQLGYGFRFMSRARLAELLQAPEQFDPPPPETPFVLLKGLEFPYTAGPLFIAAIRGNAASFESVDRAFQSPPTTSEQVLHPDRYRSGEGATTVVLPDAAGVLGSGWAVVHTDVLGEFLLKTWLAFLRRGDAALAAAGWGGDAYQVLEGPEGKSALAARVVWDVPEQDGQEFFESLVAGLDRSSALRRTDGAGPAGVIWQSEGRAIGVRLGAGGAGTLLAAAPRADQVRALLARLEEP